jgi:hypothetical protein
MIDLVMSMKNDYTTHLHAPNLNALIEKIKDWHNWENTKKSLLKFSKNTSIIDREKKSGWYYHSCGVECILIKAEDIFAFITTKYGLRINVIYNIFRECINNKSITTFVVPKNIEDVHIDDIKLMSHKNAIATFMAMYFKHNNFIEGKTVLLDCR